MPEWLVLVLIVGAAVCLWAATRQVRSRHRLTRHIYRHVDELLGARRYENDRSATRRHYLSYIDKDLARLLYPDPKLGGTMVLPPYRRQRRYVQLDLVTLPWTETYRPRDILAVTLRWTSEAPVNSGAFFEWLERGRPTSGGGLAQALGLEWSDGLFLRDTDHARARVTLTRKRVVKVAKRIDPREDLDV